MSQTQGQQQLADAIRLGNGVIERHVTETLNQLDASTHSVEIRKQLYAQFLERAAELTESRFPKG